jgi:hypothetical protein
LCAVVGDDGVMDTEIENDVLDEIYYLLGAIFIRGLIMIHLVNMLTVTSRWVKAPGAFLKGPRKFRPHMANDHVMGIVWSS